MRVYGVNQERSWCQWSLTLLPLERAQEKVVWVAARDQAYQQQG